MKNLEQSEMTAALFLAADKMCDELNSTQTQFDYSASRHDDGSVEINVTEGRSSRKHIDIEFRRENGNALYNVVQSRWHVVKSDDIEDEGIGKVFKLYVEGMKAGYTRMVADAVVRNLVELTSLDTAKCVFSEKCRCDIMM